MTENEKNLLPVLGQFLADLSELKARISRVEIYAIPVVDYLTGKSLTQATTATPANPSTGKPKQ